MDFSAKNEKRLESHSHSADVIMCFMFVCFKITPCMLGDFYAFGPILDPNCLQRLSADNKSQLCT